MVGGLGFQHLPSKKDDDRGQEQTKKQNEKIKSKNGVLHKIPRL